MGGADEQASEAASGAGATGDMRPWWRDALFYQIYPRSFQDSNGDGIGDLPGITSRLDHLESLGVDAVWLSPHFDSPNADNGYDIRDYRRVMREFGTMADFDALLAGLTARGIRLVLDLVVNHTSDEHEWFVESRRSRDNPYRDFYVWRDGRGDGPPNNYPSFFGGSAWTRDETTGQWYLHYFGAKQPDLNWDCLRVREAVYDLMRFWLDKGVAGFRMDVIPLISKHPGLPDLTADELKAPERVYASGPNVHRYLHEMHEQVLAAYGAVSIGEALGVSPEGILNFIDDRRRELALAFVFDIPRIGRDHWRQNAWTLPEWKALYARADALAAGDHVWNCVFLENHDNPRSLVAFGDPDPDWRERSSRVLATLVLTQRGTPFFYQGEEIGMGNAPFATIADYDDVEARGQWQDFVATGRVESAAFLAMLARTSRDNARTPMQWSAAPGAGFTTGRPWLPVNPDHAAVNVEAQDARIGSVLAHTRALAQLRREVPDLRRGDYEDLAPDDSALFVYRRGRHVVALNMGRDARRFALPAGRNWTVRLTTDPSRASLDRADLRLGGWEAAVLRSQDSSADS